jgi:hypothetical protein
LASKPITDSEAAAASRQSYTGIIHSHIVLFVLKAKVHTIAQYNSVQWLHHMLATTAQILLQHHPFEL